MGLPTGVALVGFWLTNRRVTHVPKNVIILITAKVCTVGPVGFMLDILITLCTYIIGVALVGLLRTRFPKHAPKVLRFLRTVQLAVAPVGFICFIEVAPVGLLVRVTPWGCV